MDNSQQPASTKRDLQITQPRTCLVTRALWVSRDPVDPIHDFNIPIRPFKHPPSRDDFQQIRRRRKREEIEHDHPAGNPPGEEGHVDDYA